MSMHLDTYSAQIDTAATRDELLFVLRNMEPGVVGDVIGQVERWTDEEFEEFMTGKARARAWKNPDVASNTEEWREKYITALIPIPIGRLWLWHQQLEAEHGG
jgi:hypothetical protein